MRKMSLICGFFLALTTANAGILIEPMIGTSFVTLEQSGVSMSATAVRFGGRLGYQMMGLFGAVQYDTASNSYEVAGIEVGSGSSNHLGVTAGYEFPTLLRLYGTYFISGQFEALDSTGIGFGIGFKPIPLPMPKMSLYANAEFRSYSFDDDTISATEILVTVSLPINL